MRLLFSTFLFLVLLASIAMTALTTPESEPTLGSPTGVPEDYDYDCREKDIDCPDSSSFESDDDKIEEDDGPKMAGPR